MATGSITLPIHWSPEPAVAVFERLNELREHVWARYVLQTQQVSRDQRSTAVPAATGAVVALAEDGAERLFFIVETKGSLFDDALRDTEVGKIMCADGYFAATSMPVSSAKFARATSVGGFEKRWE